MLLCLLVNTLLVISCVLIHYLFLAWVSYKLDCLERQRRIYLIIHVIDGLVAHMLEIFLFAVAYFYMLHHLDVGHLTGEFDGSFFDCFYFSFVTYTSVGFGDIVPDGWIRFTVGVEALLGLMMITWTASLLYLAMQRQWQVDLIARKQHFDKERS